MRGLHKAEEFIDAADLRIAEGIPDAASDVIALGGGLDLAGFLQDEGDHVALLDDGRNEGGLVDDLAEVVAGGVDHCFAAHPVAGDVRETQNGEVAILGEMLGKPIEIIGCDGG